MRPLALFLAAAATTWAVAAAAQDRDSYDFREGYRRGYDDGFANGYKKGLAESARGPCTGTAATA